MNLLVKFWQIVQCFSIPKVEHTTTIRIYTTHSKGRVREMWFSSIVNYIELVTCLLAVILIILIICALGLDLMLNNGICLWIERRVAGLCEECGQDLCHGDPDSLKPCPECGYHNNYRRTNRATLSTSTPDTGRSK
jgi:predicted RNA-binding Zn-ribbon protein involved in translation (DUF1610 family)